MDAVCTSIADAGRALGIGRTKVYELINSGALKTIKIGRRRLIRVSSIEALVSER